MSVLEGGFRLLSCVMPKGLGLPLLRRLSDELGVIMADVHSARGFSGSDARGVFNRMERDVLSAVVPSHRAEEIFQWLLEEAEVTTQRGRFLYMARLQGATPFRLPEDVPPEQA